MATPRTTAAHNVRPRDQNTSPTVINAKLNTSGVNHHTYKGPTLHTKRPSTARNDSHTPSENKTPFHKRSPRVPPNTHTNGTAVSGYTSAFAKYKASPDFFRKRPVGPPAYSSWVLARSRAS